MRANPQIPKVMLLLAIRGACVDVATTVVTISAMVMTIIGHVTCMLQIKPNAAITLREAELANGFPCCAKVSKLYNIRRE